MSRTHRRDTSSLVWGAFFLLVGGWSLAGDDVRRWFDGLDVTIDLRWVAPVVLILVGVMGLVGAARRRSAAAARYPGD